MKLFDIFSGNKPDTSRESTAIEEMNHARVTVNEEGDGSEALATDMDDSAESVDETSSTGDLSPDALATNSSSKRTLADEKLEAITPHSMTSPLEKLAQKSLCVLQEPARPSPVFSRDIAEHPTPMLVDGPEQEGPGIEKLVDQLQAVEIEPASVSVATPSPHDLPVPTTYADATNLAVLYPDLSDHFLTASLSSSSQSKESLSGEETTQEVDLSSHSVPTPGQPDPGADPFKQDVTTPAIHSTNNPNWAVANGNNEPTIPSGSNGSRYNRGFRGRGRRGRDPGRGKVALTPSQRPQETANSPRRPPRGRARGHRASRVTPNRVFTQSSRPASTTSSHSQSTPLRNTASLTHGTPPLRMTQHNSSQQPSVLQTGQVHHTANGMRVPAPADLYRADTEALFHTRMAAQLSQQVIANSAILETSQETSFQPEGYHMDKGIWIQYLNSVAHLYQPQVGGGARPPSTGPGLPHTPNAPHHRPVLTPTYQQGSRGSPVPSSVATGRYPNSALRQSLSPMERFNISDPRNSPFPSRSPFSKPSVKVTAKNGGRDSNGLVTFVQNQLAIDPGRTQDLGSSSFNWRGATVVPQTTRQSSPTGPHYMIGAGFRSKDIRPNSRINQDYYVGPQARGRLSQSKEITPQSQGSRAISHSAIS